MTLPARPDAPSWIARTRPDEAVLLFDPIALDDAARIFLAGFPGLVTYAVKANPHELVIRSLAAAGITTFDVASPAEMALVRELVPGAQLHYHNPVRSLAEIEAARAHGVTSWSVDRARELDKLGAIADKEIAVRFKLPVAGAAYDFGMKFGATPELATALLAEVARRGGKPSLTFHPGTQCGASTVWAPYIRAAAQIAGDAGVTLHRLNVGGGFPANRDGVPAPLATHFEAIRAAAEAAFDVVPPLVCEPGRGLAAESMSLVTRVKSCEGGTVFLNDGIYGALSEWRDLGPLSRIVVMTPAGKPRKGAPSPMTVFGPTCDSLDHLPNLTPLPADTAEGDFVLIAGMGAYSTALTTGFNGYGAHRVVALAAPAASGQGIEHG
jgi:ornithine decarboxylase